MADSSPLSDQLDSLRDSLESITHGIVALGGLAVLYRRNVNDETKVIEYLEMLPRLIKVINKHLDVARGIYVDDCRMLLRMASSPTEGLVDFPGPSAEDTFTFTIIQLAKKVVDKYSTEATIAAGDEGRMPSLDYICKIPISPLHFNNLLKIYSIALGLHEKKLLDRGLKAEIARAKNLIDGLGATSFTEALSREEAVVSAAIRVESTTPDEGEVTARKAPRIANLTDSVAVKERFSPPDCPKCNTKMTVPSTKIGKEVAGQKQWRTRHFKCPKCKHGFKKNYEVVD